MNVVDSSGWLEYFADGPNAAFFATAVQAVDELIVPVICIYEVFKRVASQRGEGPALQAVAIMQQGRVIDVTSAVALDAAMLSLQLRLPMADSLILATARANEAILWTLDADFAGVPGVEYRARASSSHTGDAEAEARARILATAGICADYPDWPEWQREVRGRTAVERLENLG